MSAKSQGYFSMRPKYWRDSPILYTPMTMIWFTMHLHTFLLEETVAFPAVSAACEVCCSVPLAISKTPSSMDNTDGTTGVCSGSMDSFVVWLSTESSVFYNIEKCWTLSTGHLIFIEYNWICGHFLGLEVRWVLLYKISWAKRSLYVTRNDAGMSNSLTYMFREHSLGINRNWKLNSYDSKSISFNKPFFSEALVQYLAIHHQVPVWVLVWCFQVHQRNPEHQNWRCLQECQGLSIIRSVVILENLSCHLIHIYILVKCVNLTLSNKSD